MLKHSENKSNHPENCPKTPETPQVEAEESEDAKSVKYLQDYHASGRAPRNPNIPWTARGQAWEPCVSGTISILNSESMKFQRT